MSVNPCITNITPITTLWSGGGGGYPADPSFSTITVAGDVNGAPYPPPITADPSFSTITVSGNINGVPYPPPASVSLVATVGPVDAVNIDNSPLDVIEMSATVATTGRINATTSVSLYNNGESADIFYIDLFYDTGIVASPPLSLVLQPTDTSILSTTAQFNLAGVGKVFTRVYSASGGTGTIQANNATLTGTIVI